uniref:Ankyrin repeat domain 33 n=1 Tax=Oncorhynchus kisutch TaxID=8019 RepID=A0A8C7MZG9_ONCKI
MCVHVSLSPCLSQCPGADINVVDEVRGKSIMDWALKTGRFEVLQRLRFLQAHPIAEQFCDSYVIEWPELKELVAKAMIPKTLTQRLKDSLTISLPKDPQDNGVMDHLVKMTTSIHSPLVSTGCRPLCPTSPPELGKRRLSKEPAKATTSVLSSDGRGSETPHSQFCLLIE